MSCDTSTSSSTPSSGFPSAATMGVLATNFPVVWEEICMIQQAILAASSQCQPGGGKMYTVVGGNTPMTFITGVDSISVVNGGAGYFQDSPAVKFIPPIGSIPAEQATGTVITNGGNILEITITAGGLGYQPVNSTMNVSSVSGINAELRPLVSGTGQILNIDIVNSGTGYTVDDTVTATRAVAPNIAYVDAVFRITAVSVTGEIIEVVILNPGSGYEPSTASIQIMSSLNNTLLYPLGTGFMGTVLTDINGVILDVEVDNTGAGYAVYSPYLVITDPGTGATTNVVLGAGPAATSVASVVVTNPGDNYTTSATGTVYNPSTAGLPNPPVSPAVVTINTDINTFGTNPTLYWQVWAGATTNKAIQLQLNQVQSYFTALGYTVQIKSNPTTNNTIQWNIGW